MSDELFVGCCGGGTLSRHEICSHVKTYIKTNYLKKEDVLKAIGEDNYIIKTSGNSRFDQQVQSEIDGANKLRAEIKEKLNLGDK